MDPIVISKKQQKEIAQKILEKFDKKKQGSLDKENCIDFMKYAVHPQNINDKYVDSLGEEFIQTYSADQGLINTLQLEYLIAKFCTINKPEDRPEFSIIENLSDEARKHIEAARAIFIKMDSDESGELDEAEVKQLIKQTYKKTGDEKSDEEEIKKKIDGFFKKFDMDGNRTINWKEYEQVIIKSLQDKQMKVFND